MPVEQSEWTQWFKIEKLNAVDTNYIQNDNILAGCSLEQQKGSVVLSSFHTIFVRLSKGILVMLWNQIVFNYNQHMGGVDKRDQLL